MANVFWSFRSHVVRGPAGFLAIIPLLALSAVLVALALAGFLLAISFTGVVRLWGRLTRGTAGRWAPMPDGRHETGFSAAVRRGRTPNLTINSTLQLLSNDGIGFSAGTTAGRPSLPVATVSITEVDSAKESKS